MLPNEVRKGDVVVTMDGDKLTVVDNGKGFRRNVAINGGTHDGDRGSAYVFDWETVHTTDGQTHAIRLPLAYVKAYGKIADGGVYPGRLNGPAVVTHTTAPVWPKNPSVRYGWNGERPVEGTEYITDGNACIRTEALAPSAVKRLRTRSQADRVSAPVPLSMVQDVWDANTDGKAPMPFAVTPDMDSLCEVGNGEKWNPKRRLVRMVPRNLHADIGDVWVDYEKLRLVQSLAKVKDWYAQTTPYGDKIDDSRAIQGRTRIDVVCILMPVRRPS